jgi:hypothetical protein
VKELVAGAGEILTTVGIEFHRERKKPFFRPFPRNLVKAMTGTI